MLRVHSSLPLFSEALDIQTRYQLSWCDSLIVAAALDAGCGQLLTEAPQHGQRFGKLSVVNPFLELPAN